MKSFQIGVYVVWAVSVGTINAAELGLPVGLGWSYWKTAFGLCASHDNEPDMPVWPARPPEFRLQEPAYTIQDEELV